LRRNQDPAGEVEKRTQYLALTADLSRFLAVAKGRVKYHQAISRDNRMKREPETKSDPTPPAGGLRAYVLIQTLPGRLEGVARALRRIPTVLTVDSVAGPYDIVALVEVTEIRDFSHLVAGSIAGLKGVTRTTTLICT
jgi:DNA-binding Lrp family transcriptional regulator